MGTHPIFESDFDCLTEMSGGGDGKEVLANQSAMQVQNLKLSLNEWKYVITTCDGLVNTPDPVKTAAAYAGIYTTVYVVFLVTNPTILTMLSILLAFGIIADTFIGKINDKLFAQKEFTNEMDTRFHAFCSGLVGSTVKLSNFISFALKMKAESPYRFLSYALPILGFSAYLGKKMSIITIFWLSLMVECATMVPQVKQLYDMIKTKVAGIVQKTSKKTE